MQRRRNKKNTDVTVITEQRVAAVDDVEFTRVCFVNFILYRNLKMTLIFNLSMCVYVNKICEEKFRGCKRSFSRLSQKVKHRHALRIFVTVIL